MSQENEAADLRVKALESAYSEPEKGLKALWQIVRRYPDTWTAKNLVADDIIDVARVNQLWDEVISACAQAKELKPDYAKSYSLEAEAALLMKQGRQIEALEIYLKQETLHGTWFGTLRNFGIKFAELGAHDRAWALFNQAVVCAANEGKSPDSVRQPMARLLIKEGRTASAVEMLLVGYWEAYKLEKKGAPKSMV